MARVRGHGPRPGGRQRLLALLTKYGSAIEADFASGSGYPGIDPLELYARGKWRKLLNLIDQLGSNARWRSAQYNDPDVADQAAAFTGQVPSTPPAPEWHDWSPIRSDLAEVRDLLHNLIYQGSGSKKAPKPVPRPETEVHRRRAAAAGTIDDGVYDDVLSMLGVESVI